MKRFTEYINEWKWVRPSPGSEHDETQWQHGHTGPTKELGKFKNKFTYMNAMRTAKVERITPSQTNNLGNHGGDIENEKLKRMKSTAIGQRNREMPIIMHNRTTGERHLLAGNTRTTHTTKIEKKPLKALIIRHN